MPQEGSSAAPSPTFEAYPVKIVLSPKEQTCLHQEVERLKNIAIICRIIGNGPSRGDLRTLLQSNLQGEDGKILSIHFLGRGFYQLEMESSESIQRIMQLNPLDLRGAKSFFMPWKHGFNPQEVIEKGEKVHVLTVSLLGLHSEYLPILSKLGSRVGTILEGMGQGLRGSSKYPEFHLFGWW